MSERILVTGGAGFIGSHTVDALVRRGYDVRIFDNLHPQVHGPDRARPSWLNPHAEFVFGDVRDPAALQKAIQGIDFVIHDAALVGVGQSQYAIAEYNAINVQGTANLLDALANTPNKVRRLVVASSMSIYGEGRYLCAEHGAFDGALRPDAQLDARDWAMKCPVCGADAHPLPTAEGKKLGGASFYAETKRFQEELALLFGRIYKLPTVALRYFNAYGPRQSLANPYTGVAAIFLSRLKAGTSPLVYEDGNQSRDFTSVHDIVQAKIVALESAIQTGAYNVGTGRRTSVLDIAGTLGNLLNSDVAPTTVGRYRSGDIRDCYADISALSRYGYRPKVSLEEGLRELAAWAEDAPSADQVQVAHGELERRGLVR